MIKIPHGEDYTRAGEERPHPWRRGGGAMKIRRISILGFKSFMDRLEIVFPDGISGIVGPNGCGKSNIIDAIRWCLGEQSPRQLRGRKMEDIIFGGAGAFKPLGMAEVSLVFENGNGASGVPAVSHFAELSVTRRLYRSGESEYLLNNVPCRLKDIQEVFMDTGLGNRPYSIIGQGRIGSILEQRPEETRVMIEEAAGVTRYRKRVEETEKRIALTEANLARVEDILAEVQTQMRSMQRQASRAKKYKALSEEIRRLELTLHANAYQRLGQEQESRERATQALEEKEALLSARLSERRLALQSMLLVLDDRDRALQETRGAYLALKDALHEKSSALDALRREIQVLSERLTRQGQEKEDLLSRSKAMGTERETIEGRLREIRGAAVHVEGEIALEEERIRRRRSSLGRMKETFDKIKEELSNGRNREVALQHESGYLAKMLRQISDADARYEKELSEAQAKSKALLERSERKGELREITAARLREIEAEIQETASGCQDLEEEKEILGAETKKTEKELTALESRLGTLRGMVENFEGCKVGVRTLMKATDLPAKAEGRILGLLADRLRVSPEDEAAVEAWLGERVQQVLVRTREDALEGVAYLKEKGKGRCSFLALEGPPEGETSSPGERPSPLLGDRVLSKGEDEAGLRALLGRCYLVKDLERALGLWKDLRQGRGGGGERFQVATPEGDLIDENGVISGGKQGQGTVGLLARRREMEDLARKLEALRGVLETREGEEERVSLALQAKRRALETLREERWTCQEELNDMDKHVFRMAQELDHLSEIRKRIQADKDKRERERARHEGEIRRIEGELRENEERRLSGEALVAAKERDVREAEAEYEEIREGLSLRRASLEGMRQEERGLEREIRRLTDYMEESAGRLARIEEETSSALQKQEVSKERQRQLVEEEAWCREALLDKEASMQRAENERQTLQGDVKGEERRIEEIRADHAGVREELGRARMETSEVRFRMQALVDLVQQLFNMDLREILLAYLDLESQERDLEKRLEEKRGQRQALGEVNLMAIEEHEALKERAGFIDAQKQDLLHAIESLRTAIEKINRTSEERFMEVFRAVNAKLGEVFPLLFHGGSAALRLIDESRPLETGVLVEVQPPGKRLSHMGLLSGGEKALVAMALIFSMYMIKPSPFCLLDEVDAPLDDANLDRFNHLLMRIKEHSQIIMVTHNRRSMEIADRLYGVTMEKAGVSRTLSVDIKDRTCGALPEGTTAAVL